MSLKQFEFDFFHLFGRIFHYLPNKKRTRFYMLMGLIIVFALFETLSLASIALFASAVSDPGTVLDSRYFGFFQDTFFPASPLTPQALILGLSLLVIFLVTLKNGIKGVTMYWISRFSAQVESFFGHILLQGFLYLPYDWHLQKNTADLVYAVERRRYIGRDFMAPCLKGLRDLIMIAVMLAALLVVQPVISLLVLVVLGGSAYFIYVTVRKQIDLMSTRCRIYEENMNLETTKAVHGIKDIKVAQRERSFADNFSKNAKPFAHYYGWLEFFNQSSVLILESVGFLLICGSICLMLFFMDLSTGVITGTVALLAVTAWRVLPGLTRLVKSMSIIRRSFPYVAKELEYVEFIGSRLDNPQKFLQGTHSCLDFQRELRLEEVSFAYPGDGKSVFKDVSLRVAKGSTLGIIGTSGAGKSTLVDLVIGLLKPQSGRILIDGRPLEHNLVDNWIACIGYVPQAPYIYDGTLAENVAFGYIQAEIDRDRVEKCCRLAAMEFLDELSRGIDTLVGERGIRLSGGQRQRVAIARALYKQPEVIIFDEATSSLDSVTEKSILQTIYSFKGLKTLIIIAHRLSTVKECDELVWLEKGRVVMQGRSGVVLQEYSSIGRNA
ncbi:MAG: ABC transporter ATP-binding protein/permease [Desulfohalobiaceae bacterium]|nr:ABC transporter ATP-binding protein/permease [Desulfohalobiaceae bacterium]